MLKILTKYSKKRKDFLKRKKAAVDSFALGSSQTPIFIA